MKCDDYSFDVFHFEEISNGHALTYVLFGLFYKHNLFERMRIDKEKLFRFLQAVERGYRAEIPYHNASHAADVLQTVNCFVMSIQCSLFTAEDLVTLFIACALHDYRHPGVTERFCVDSNHEYSLLYNDIYVLESFHAAAAFQLLLSPDEDMNIFSSWHASKRHQLRTQIIRLILATNLTDHFSFIKAFGVAMNNQSVITEENKHFVMQAMIKCADVSNPVKPFHIYAHWVSRILEEFFLQGDIEKTLGMTVSRFMDRENPEVPQCQIGFIDFIVFPMYRAVSVISDIFSKQCLPAIEKNREIWANTANETTQSERPPVLHRIGTAVSTSALSLNSKPRRTSNFNSKINPSDATTGIRSLPSTSLPNRIFGEGRTPIYDYSYLYDDAQQKQKSRPAGLSTSNLSKFDSRSPVHKFSQSSGKLVTAALAAVASTARQNS